MENQAPTGAYVILYIAGILSLIVGLISILVAPTHSGPDLAMDLRMIFAGIFCGLLFIGLGYIGSKLHQIVHLMKTHAAREAAGMTSLIPAASLPLPETAP